MARPSRRATRAGGASLAVGSGVVDSTISSTGVVTAVYRRGGDVEYGSFTFDEPDAAELARREKLAGA